MTGSQDGRATLAALVDELQTALALWGTRDDQIAQPQVTAAGVRAMNLIDDLTRTLYRTREALMLEARVSEDVAMARTDRLLADIRAMREPAPPAPPLDEMVPGSCPGCSEVIQVAAQMAEAGAITGPPIGCSQCGYSWPIPQAGCQACRVMGPLLTAPGTSGRSWACECGTVWEGRGAGAVSGKLDA